MPLIDKLKKTGPIDVPREPLWKGPEEDGVTFSLLNRFLGCRERFRLKVIEGLAPSPTFNHRMEFGQMWHVCEEELAKGGGSESFPYRGADWWIGALKDYCHGLCRTYSTQQEQIDHWYNVVKVTFPEYVAHWSKHPDVIERSPLLSEKVFDVPYQLPNGLTVRLRGKWDSVDMVRTVSKPGTKSVYDHGGIWLQENKTKGDINEEQIRRQLSMDLQTMLYLTALTHDTGIEDFEEAKMRIGRGKTPHEKSLSSVIGVRYNVIRRPLSGGKGTIVRHKPSKSNPQGESKEDFYRRLAQYIKDEPGSYFMRWECKIRPGDIEAFRQRVLNPLLHQLCQWWDWVTSEEVKKHGPFHDGGGWGVHSQHPFGCYNVLDEGGSTDYDAYLATGSTVGLSRATTLFSELEGG